MTFVLRVFFFLAAFTLDIRVRAESWVTLPEEKHAFQFPENCIVESSTCAVRTHKNTRFTLKRGEQKIILSGSTSYLRRGAQSGTLLSGTVLIQTPEPLEIETPYGTIKTEKGEFLVSRSRSRYLVRVLEGEVVIVALGSTESVIIPTGFENWLAPVNRLGVAQVGLPGPISFHAFLMQWGALFSGSKRDFETAVRHFQVGWREAVGRSSEIYRGLVEREIASEKDRQHQLALRRAREAAERKKMNDLFRKKVFE